MTGKKDNIEQFTNAKKQMDSFRMNSEKIGKKIAKGGVKVIGNTKQAIAGLEELSEMGFTKQFTRKNRRKDDAFGNIGL